MSRNAMKLTPQGDREVVIERSFDAPRDLVFEAFIKPELVQRWMLGPDGWSMPVCTIDLRPGGKGRYEWQNADRSTGMSLNTVFKEVVVPERIVHTERFDPDWAQGEATVTTLFTEKNGKTTVTMKIVYASADVRDMVLKSGMDQGMARSYERLDDVLKK